MRSGIRRMAISRRLLVASGVGAGLLLAPAIAEPLLAGRIGEGRPPIENPSDAGAARFLAALDRAREGDLAGAREQLVAAEAAGVPEAPSHLAEVDRRLAFDAVRALVTARLAAGDPTAAAEALSGVTSAPELAPIVDEVRVRARERRERLDAMATGESAGDVEQARSELARLAAAFPGDPALAVTSLPGQRSAGDTTAARALAAFRKGHLGEARAAVAGCRDSRCRSIDRTLSAVEAALADRSSTGRWTALEGILATVRRLGSSPIERAIGEELAPWHHAAGIEALRRGDPGAARQRFDRALAVQPGYPPAAAERDRLRERAREAFLAGYVEKEASPEEARQKFRLVTTMTGPDDEVHRKARRWLERLDGGSVPPRDPEPLVAREPAER